MYRKSFLQILLVVAIALAGANAAFGGLIVEVRVSAGPDDAEEAVNPGNQDTYNTSSDLELIDDNNDNGGRQFVGMNFRNVQVPLGAQIKRAYIEFACDASKFNSDPAYLLLWGHLDPNPDGFGGALTPTSISDRPRTEAKVPWEPEPWTTGGQLSQTSDISSIINEIISQDGWATGNAIEIIVGEDTSKGEFTGFRAAESFNGVASLAPLLVIELSTKFASSPSPADGTLYEDTWASLGWEAGETAVTHDVYMSDKFDDVSGGAAAAFQGNQALAFFTVGFPGFAFPDGLVPGTTYYWRIDEVEADGATKHKGPVWSFSILDKTAYDPSPRDGARAVDPDVTLSWTPGYGAKLHTVYFGNDFDTVSNAAGGLPQGVAAFTPGTLEKDNIYYWRVDEFNPPETVKGDVWSFRTLPDIVITDPNLIGWWKLDNISGDKVLDWSGYGNDGKTGGNPQLVEGFVGSGLDLDGSDYIAIDGVVDDITSTNITLSIWIKSTQTSQGDLFAANDSASGHPLEFYIEGGYPGRYDGGDTTYTTAPLVADGQWHMMTYVRSGSRGYIYVDGVQVATDSASFDLSSVTRWSIGQEWDDSTASNFYAGLVDDARFYNKALTQPEIAEIMRGDPLLAWNPRPANNATLDVEQAAQPLGWSPGDNAVEHDVHFGTDKDAVKNADTLTADVYRGRQAGTTYSVPEGLEWGTGPYYWRVDEINTDGSVSAGSVWSFSVADYLIVDDFESYNDIEEGEPGSNRLYMTWLDGFDNPTTNGAIVGNLNVPIAETRAGYVHSGAQAMPLSYNNIGKHSEATLALTGTARDWTRQGVGQLSLWFRGEPTNGAERMYVALDGRAVYNDNPNVTQVDVYEEWVIPLQTFADLGVNLSNVTSVAIGFGTPGSTASGGSGTMYIDDLRLYRVSP
ncbi:MAG: hypothetical protein AMJ65_07325 [Phycisphaerae bacterium SG8_4]|nr:MAG: hypothetical protein AMJ65_07325 [Phycisphaerae bacterium SG8_4]